MTSGVVLLQDVRTSKREKEHARCALLASMTCRCDEIAWKGWTLLRLPPVEARDQRLMMVMATWAPEELRPEAFEEWIDNHRNAISVSLESVADEADVADIFEPDLLKVLYGLDRSPDQLRTRWIRWLSDRSLLVLAGAFGRPFYE